MKTPAAIQILAVFMVFGFTRLSAQVNTVSSDKEWDKQQVTLKNVPEAAFIIRIGDVDNLGFGWPEGYDPFCGRTSESHDYPWEAKPADLPGFDRILLSPAFIPDKDHPCGGDGYSANYLLALMKPVIWSIPTVALKGTEIKNAFLQLFIDDFQAPTFCSKFRLFLNGDRFAEGERLLNAIDQTGPVGKLLTIPLPEEFYNQLVTKDNITFKIEESTGAADGYALDFIRLLVNRNLTAVCKGNITGRVLDKTTETPLTNAKVWLADNRNTQTDENGMFIFKDIPTGYEIISASYKGYTDGSVAADVGQGEGNQEVTIYLTKGNNTIRFDNKEILAGETVKLSNIMFEQGKADLNAVSKTELDKLVSFLQENQNAEIELSGHTSSEGDAGLNRSLSYKRVKACKDYILLKGIDAGRIIAVGFGPDKPVAPNDTEANRALNRRVEMRLEKL
jgi:outer membrane protein OmpA-like peptidoglycan-associated protein